jgi:hypothetical protein
MALMKASGMRLKATTFRTYVGILDKERKLAAVTKLLPVETAAMIADPPLPASWMDLIHMYHITEAVEKIGGMNAVRELARKGTEAARRPYMSVVEGLLRLFGASPATLFKRMNTLVRVVTQGVEYEYTVTGERSGVMVMTHKTHYALPMSIFFSTIPALQTLLDVCGVKGTVSDPGRLSPQAARFVISW